MSTQLSLFVPSEEPEQEDDGAPSKRWTLSQAFERYVLPRMTERNWAPATIEDYLRTIDDWETCSGNPSIGSITDQTLATHARQLQSRPLAARTINKRLSYIEAILRQLGPRRKSQFGITAGLLAELPLFERMTETPEADARIATNDELQRIITACSEARWPRRQGPAIWRALFMLLAWIGPRRDDALRHIQQDALIETPACPLQRCRQFRSEFGWLRFTPTKTKRRKPHPLVLPVSQELHDALSKINRSVGETRLIPMQAETNHGYLYTTLARIQTAAEIEDPYSFQDLRATCSVRWDEAGGFGAGDHVLGHSKRSVNDTYYRAAIPPLLKALPRVERIGQRSPVPIERSHNERSGCPADTD